VREREVPTLLVPIEKLTPFIGPHWRLALYQGPKRVGVSFPSPDDRRETNFRKVVLLVFRIPDDG
jgi:hypothetical protein